MDKPVTQVVIVGGGSAGWLTAAIIAADHFNNGRPEPGVTVIESPRVGTIGVGEGTWPSMRLSLKRAGIKESEFLTECSASFKQGSKFVGWRNGRADDFYYHPFMLPHGYPDLNLAYGWQKLASERAFADAVCVQPQLCDAFLAPKQKTTPDYAGVVNYAYHLDATRFGNLLQRHCCSKLGVKHLKEHVIAIESHEDGDIAAIVCESGAKITGDLFIDCTGFESMLLGKHYGIPPVSQKNVLFNDSALAMQVPYPEADTPIASPTIGTAQQNGWIWDIGLTSRRGIGHVYSSAHARDDQVEAALRAYVEKSIGRKAVDALDARKISYAPAYRQKFWHRNCVAVGSAAAFIEPLEASALVTVELSAIAISEEMPASRHLMDIVAERFNKRFLYRWARVIEFLKLHYVLSQRTDSDFWLDNRRPETIPERLSELLELWRHRSPSARDFTDIEEIFPAASYQYILYGMGFGTEFKALNSSANDLQKLNEQLMENKHKLKKLRTGLPTNRVLLNHLAQKGV